METREIVQPFTIKTRSLFFSEYKTTNLAHVSLLQSSFSLVQTVSKGGVRTLVNYISMSSSYTHEILNKILLVDICIVYVDASAAWKPIQKCRGPGGASSEWSSIFFSQDTKYEHEISPGSHADLQHAAAPDSLPTFSVYPCDVFAFIIHRPHI